VCVLMQAPLSKKVRKILADRELSKKLMQAILAERSDPQDVEKRTILVDGEKFRLVRVTSLNKQKD
jgi:hypothetical protein